jgi:hypothetical protein
MQVRFQIIAPAHGERGKSDHSDKTRYKQQADSYRK